MPANSSFDLLHAQRTRYVPYSSCPAPTRMQSIPRGSFVGARVRVIAVLAETLTNFHFLIPHWLEVLNQVIFRRFNPCTSYYQVSAIEVREIQRVRSVAV